MCWRRLKEWEEAGVLLALCRPQRLIADRGYDSNAPRRYLKRRMAASFTLPVPSSCLAGFEMTSSQNTLWLSRRGFLRAFLRRREVLSFVYLIYRR